MTAYKEQISERIDAACQRINLEELRLETIRRLERDPGADWNDEPRLSEHEFLELVLEVAEAALREVLLEAK